MHAKRAVSKNIGPSDKKGSINPLAHWKIRKHPVLKNHDQSGIPITTHRGRTAKADKERKNTRKRKR